MVKQRLIVGMSGASGAPLTVELLRQLKQLQIRRQQKAQLMSTQILQSSEQMKYTEQSEVFRMSDLEVGLVYTKGAMLTLEQETDLTVQELEELADVVYDNEEIGAAIASGSFQTIGMIVVPCSMKTLAGIHSGYSDNLLLRAADVTLKERRKLVLAVRECPFSPIHLRNMYELSQMGAVILPPMLSYYQRPASVEECTRHIVGKLLDQFGLPCQEFQRWNGIEKKSNIL